GMENINARAEKLGMDEMELNRMMMDFNALAEGRDNHITAMSLARLYKHIFECRDRDAYGREMWNILGRQQFRDILPFYWGEGIRFHHKTGSLDRVEHDGGVIETFRGHFCFILLMSDIDNDRGKELGAQVGRIMKEFVEEALP
ncbi:MAG: serine hydrolase, partial [Veillonella sp.]|nr:serine hydrolase [Veillonella sp.]